MLDDLIKNNEKLVLVGMNSQGKTSGLESLKKIYKNEAIFVANETKANESLKNSTDSSPLITWLERLLDLNKLKKVIDKQISEIDFSEINKENSVNVRLQNSTINYKGLISADITTKSNKWGIPGSGETFYGQLMIIEKMLENVEDNPIKLLMIDEPETFLHPSLYVNICALLRKISKNIKVVISTHSPEILKYFIDDLEEIIIVKNGKFKKLEKTEFYINLKREIQIYGEGKKYKSTEQALSKFNSYFDVFLKPIILECLFSEIVVIGEGVAEKVLFECVKNKYDSDYKLASVNFITVYGKDFIPLLILIFKNIGLKVFTIYDKDSDKKDEPTVYINAYIEKNCDAKICFEEDIETELEIEKDSNKYFKSIIVPNTIKTMYLKNNEKLLNLISNIKNQIDKL